MIKRVYPVLLSDELAKSRDFYQRYLDFELTFSNDWYVSLINAAGFELALMDWQHETIPPHQRQVAKGVILNIEVADAKAYYEKLSRCQGVEMVVPPRDEAFGQRHFSLLAPNQLLVDIIQVIPPTAAFSADYQESVNEP